MHSPAGGPVGRPGRTCRRVGPRRGSTPTRGRDRAGVYRQLRADPSSDHPAAGMLMYRRIDAHPAPLHDRSHRPVPLRPGRGGPCPHAHHADRRQAQGHRQGRPSADVAPGWQPRAVRRTDRRPGPWPDVRRRDRSPRRACLAEPARLARVGGDGVVPRGTHRPLARGAARLRAAVCPAEARL